MDHATTRRTRIALALLVSLLAVSTALAQNLCISGPVPHEIDFHVTATADLDEFVFWDPEPEMFLEILVDGIEICRVDKGDGWQLGDTCSFDIEEPYDPVLIDFRLWDSDEPLDGYTVDINPVMPDKYMIVEYEPKCGTVGAPDPSIIPGCPLGDAETDCRGQFQVDDDES
jgi:hypothetical protein